MTKDLYTWRCVSGTSISHGVFIKKGNTEENGGDVVTECDDLL